MVAALDLAVVVQRLIRIVALVRQAAQVVVGLVAVNPFGKQLVEELFRNVVVVVLERDQCP